MQSNVKFSFNMDITTLKPTYQPNTYQLDSITFQKVSNSVKKQF